ncbi:hypothetical protein HWX16_21055 [Ochrobactrum intermedium]|uniref:hypothetical protein n=1 Tax=Brucella intermedia TaxID=94625 RepID=UPI00159C3BDA|nr:hypothetical protein [Brucella intermedia]NVM42805.1 hypothetical protein [Brucella intermedia]
MHNVFTKCGEQSAACIVADRDLSNFNNHDLHCCYDALYTVRTTLTGFINQPRFLRDQRPTPASIFLEQLLEFLDEVETIVVRTNAMSAPNDVEQSEWRKWLMIKSEANCTDSLEEFGKLVRSLTDGAKQ